MMRYLAATLFVLLLVAVFAALGWRGDAALAGAARDAAVTAKQDAEAERDNLRATLTKEREQATNLATIGDTHEQDRSAAAGVPAAVVAAIGDGTLKLRKQWAACETSRLSEATAASLERDALAQLRTADQGSLVRIGRDADDHVRACQATVAEYAQ